MMSQLVGLMILFSALGVILSKKPVHSCLFFLVTLLSLAAYYLELHASFIAVAQILIYAGAILVIFMFVIILFQDAFIAIDQIPPKSYPLFLYCSLGIFLIALGTLAWNYSYLHFPLEQLPEDFGTVQSLGKTIYTHYFFPFEATILLFLVGIVGAFFIGRKEA